MLEQAQDETHANREEAAVKPEASCLLSQLDTSALLNHFHCILFPSLLTPGSAAGKTASPPSYFISQKCAVLFFLLSLGWSHLQNVFC